MSIAPNRLVPYAGLRPFRSDEDYLFFGREEQTAELVRLLREHRFLAVVGRSGSGKSSLVRAGLLPEIQGGMMQRAGSAWEIAILRPGGHPIRNLAESLVEADLYDVEDEESVPRLLATLNHSALGLVEAVRQSEIERDANLLVVVDQFEELFRFEQHDAGAQDEAHAFVELLLEASRSREVPIYVVLTMRSDYLGDCAHVPGLAEAVNRGEYLIPRLDRNQLRAAIEGPAKVGGATMSYRLVQHLLNELGDEEDQLPILQHALMRTWSFWESDHANEEEVDLRHYEGTGGMQEAISVHADEIFEALPDDRHRAVAERLFRSLTIKGEDNRGVRRPTRLDTLAEIAGEDLAIVRAVIDAYRRQGVTFLMPGEETALEEDTVVDLSHESLMRVWQRLRRWVDDEAQSARIYQRLRETAHLWKEGKAGLYHDPDLSIAQTWREENRPNADWAELYGGGFETATAFLDESHEAAAREERAREEARQRELEQAKALAESQARTATLLKRFAVTVAAAAVLAIGLALLAMRQTEIAKEEREIARGQTIIAKEAQVEAQAAADFAEQAQGRTWLANAHTLLEAGDSFGARLKAMRALGFAGTGRENMSAEQREAFPALLEEGEPGWREAEALINENAGIDLLWQNGALAQHAAGINCIDASPDGRYIATTSEAPNPEVESARGRAWELENVVHVWDGETGRLLTVLQGRVSDNEVVGFSPDSRYLALAGDDEIEFWKIEDGQFVPTTDAVIKAAPRDQSTLLSAPDPDGSESAPNPSPPDFRSMAFSPDGTTLVLGDDHGRLYAWKNWRSFADLPGVPVQEHLHSGRIFDLEFQPGRGAILASVARNDETVKLLDGRTFELLPGELTAQPFTRGGQTAQFLSVSFSSDGTHLAAAGDHLPVTIWEVAGRTAVATLLEKEWAELTDSPPDGSSPDQLGFRALCVSFSRQGNRLAVGWLQSGNDNDPEVFSPTVTLYDVSEGPAFPRGAIDFPVEKDHPRLLAFTNGGNSLTVATSAGQGQPCYLSLRDLESGQYVSYQGRSHNQRIRSLEFSRDGLLFASADRVGTIRIWEARTGTLLHTIAAHEEFITGLRFSIDGRRLFSTGFVDKRFCAWDVATGEAAHPAIEYDYGLTDLAVTPNGESVVVGGYWNKFDFYDPETLELQRSLNADHGNTIRFTPDGSQAIVARNKADGTPEVTAYELTSGDDLLNSVEFDLAATDGEVSRLNDVAISPDGLTMAISFEDGLVRTWTRGDALRWDPGLYLPMPGGARQARLTFDRYGRLITGDQSGQVCVWDLSTRGSAELLHLLPGADQVTQLATSPDGTLVVTGSQNGLLQMWSISPPDTVIAEIDGIGTQDTPSFFPRGAHALAFARQRRLLFTAARGDSENPNAVVVWRFEHGALVQEGLLEGHASPVSELVLSADERYLATGARNLPSSDTSIRIWDLETGESRVLLEYAGIPNMTFSPDRRTIAAYIIRGPDKPSSPTPVLFLDVEGGGEPVAETIPFQHLVFGMAFTPDGEQIMIADSDFGQPLQTFKFDPSTRATEPVHALPGNIHRRTQIAISPDGSFFSSAIASSAQCELWNLPDYTPRGPVMQIEGAIWAYATAISPDGSLAAFGGGNSRVMVVRTDGSGEVVATYQGSEGVTKINTGLIFDSDNRTLFMSFNDGKVVVWRLPSPSHGVHPERYLDVVDLDEPSSPIDWDLKNRVMGPSDSSQSFSDLGLRYLPFLERPLSPSESRRALYEHYLGEGLFQSAYAVLLAMTPEESADLWPELSLAITRALRQDPAAGTPGTSGPLWHLAQRIFAQHPPSLDVQILLQINNHDWTGLATLLRERLPGLPAEERTQILANVFATLDELISALLTEDDLLAADDPAVPSRELLLAASLYRASELFTQAWEVDPWTAAAALQTGPPAALLLDRLGEAAQEMLIPSGSSWNYLDRLGAPETDWKQAGAGGQAWKSGTAPIGYGGLETMSYGTRLRTVLQTRETVAAGNEPQLAYYFRKEFTVPANWDSQERLSASFLCDDGLALFLDGREILRHNLRDEVLTPESTASQTVGEEKESRIRKRLPAFALEPGRHVLAAEVHQANDNSSDILFDFALFVPAENTWRSAESLQTGLSFLTALDPEHECLTWLAAFSGDSSEAAMPSALRARILGALELKDEALAVADRRLAALQDSYDPVDVGERKRWLRWKANLLELFGHPQSEVEAIREDFRSIPPRDPHLDPRQIDLTNYYTNSFYQDLNQAAIPETFVPRKGVAYDLRGAIALNSGLLPQDRTVREIREARDGFTAPDKVEGIAIGQKTSAIHFLLNSMWGRESEAVEVGKLVLHYEDGTTAERPLIFLEDVVDWWAGDGKPGLPQEKIGWENPRPHPPTSLAEFTWEHPHPEKTIVSLDFVSSLRQAGPFLVGITLE